MSGRPVGEALPPDHDHGGRVDVSVIVPILNEANTLDELCGRTIETLASRNLDFEIILVDDGSTDDTWPTIRTLGAAHRSVRGVRLVRNAGQTAAWCAGIEASRGDQIVTLDADLDTYPEDIPVLLDALDAGAHAVNGSRSRRTMRRGIASRMFNARMRSNGIIYSDIGCGMMALDRDTALEVLGHGEMRRSYRFKVLLATLVPGVVEVSIRSDRSSPTNYRYAELLIAGLEAQLAARRTIFLKTVSAGFAVMAVAALTFLGAGFEAVVRASPGSAWVMAWATCVGLLGGLIALAGLVSNLILRAQLNESTPFHRVAEVMDPDETS